MLEQFVFENHLGQRFTGLENGVYMNIGDIRDYSWSYDKINDRISRFYRTITSRKIPLYVFAENDYLAAEARNRLFDLAEADIEAKQPGRIYVGDYYTHGYITASKKSDYLKSKRLCKLDLTFVSDDPAWYKEKVHPFFPDSDSDITSADGSDYPYDYPYDYALTLTGKNIVCDSVMGSAFRMLIYGPVTDPSITIGGHVYAVSGTVGAGETLLIDSVNKTITLTTADGRKINWFDRRGRQDYIFEKIPAGKSVVSWIGTFGFELTAIERRSEPKWTI